MISRRYTSGKPEGENRAKSATQTTGKRQNKVGKCTRNLLYLCTMGNLIDEFIEYIRGIKRFSARTQQGYRDVLEDFAEYLQRELDRLGETPEVNPGVDLVVLRGMTSQVIRGYEVYLMKEKKLSARSVGLYLSVLSSFAKYLMKKELLSANPVRTVSRPKVPKRLPEFYRKEAIDSYFEQTRPYAEDTILDILGQSYAGQADSEPVREYGRMKAAKSYAGQADGEPVRMERERMNEKERERENVREKMKELEMELYGKCLRRLIISILYNTGIRRSELIGLNLESFDPARGVLHVHGKGDKMREIPLTSSLCEEILLYLEVARRSGFEIDRSDSPLLLTPTGKRLYPVFVDKAVKTELGSIPSISSRKSPHVLRHTIATELLDEGADIESIKELLGHSSLAATQVYTHNSIEKLKKVYNQAHPRCRSSKKQ